MIKILVYENDEMLGGMAISNNCIPGIIYSDYYHFITDLVMIDNMSTTLLSPLVASCTCSEDHSLLECKHNYVEAYSFDSISFHYMMMIYELKSSGVFSCISDQTFQKCLVYYVIKSRLYFLTS